MKKRLNMNKLWRHVFSELKDSKKIKPYDYYLISNVLNNLQNYIPNYFDGKSTINLIQAIAKDVLTAEQITKTIKRNPELLEFFI